MLVVGCPSTSGEGMGMPVAPPARLPPQILGSFFFFFFVGEPGKCIAGTGERGLGKGWVLEGRGLCAVAPEREAELAGNDVNGERERLCRGGGERAARELTP